MLNLFQHLDMLSSLHDIDLLCGFPKQVRDDVLGLTP